MANSRHLEVCLTESNLAKITASSSRVQVMYFTNIYTNLKTHKQYIFNYLLEIHLAKSVFFLYI